MIKNLVTTPFVDTFSSTNENIIIGQWCLRELNETKNNFSIAETPYHWADESKIKKDYEYLKEFYYRAIKKFTSLLNNYHEIDKPERYWHIILGTFFANFIPLVWDRWETISNLSKNEFKTTILINSENIPVFEDFKDFFMSFNDHYWNHQIYIEIIKVLKDKSFTYQTKQFNYQKKKYKKKNNFFFSILGIFFNPLLKNNDYLFYDMAFSKFNYFKLNLALKQIPTINNKLDRKIFHNTTLKRDKLKIKNEGKNQFENFCYNLIIKNLPKSYLENYKKLKEYTDEIDLNPQKIITSYAHVNNDKFKIWSAEQVLKGKKLIITDHGGYVDESSYFYSMEKYSDIYLKWNKTDSLSSKQVPPSLFLDKRKILKKTDLGNKILFLTTNCHLYSLRVGPSPISTTMVEEQKEWIDFLKKIIKVNEFNLKVRVHPRDNWNFKKIFLENFEKDLLSKKKKLEHEIKSSKLIINTTLQTTFIESMKSGVPTIVINKGFTVDVPSPVKLILKKLSHNNILFHDFEKALNHISKIQDDPLLWWNSNQIQEIREDFASCCSLETNDNFRFWTESLRKI